MRSITSVVELEEAKNKVIASFEASTINTTYSKFSKEIQTKATSPDAKDRYLANDVSIGMDSATASKGHLFFHINKGCDSAVTRVEKGYITFKDLNKFSISKFKSFLNLLVPLKLNIDVKIFKDLAHIGALTNDQIVIHGNSKDDIATVLHTAKTLFSSEISQTCLGYDKKVGKN